MIPSRSPRIITSFPFKFMCNTLLTLSNDFVDGFYQIVLSDTFPYETINFNSALIKKKGWQT